MIGVGQRIVKHLNLMFKINVSVKDLMKKSDLYPKKIFPVQANLTLSYDIFGSVIAGVIRRFFCIKS